MRTRMKGFCLFTGLLLMCFAAFGEEASVEKDLTGASVDVAAVLLVENEDASAQDSVSISEAPPASVPAVESEIAAAPSEAPKEEIKMSVEIPAPETAAVPEPEKATTPNLEANTASGPGIPATSKPEADTPSKLEATTAEPKTAEPSQPETTAASESETSSTSGPEAPATSKPEADTPSKPEATTSEPKETETSQPESTTTPEHETTASPEPVPSPASPTDEPTTPTPTASEEPSPTPEATPAPEDDAQQAAFVPTQDAWTQFADQTFFEGTVQSVLEEARRRNERPAIYVRTREKVTLTNIEQSYLDCLTPDPEVFDDEEGRKDYRVVWESGERASDGSLPPITLQVENVRGRTRAAASPEPTATAASEATVSPETEPSEEPAAPADASDGELPEPLPSDPPQEPPVLLEDAQAWARYSDGQIVQGSVQEILDSLGMDEAETGELPTAYIRTRDKVRLENIAEAFLRRITLLPDAEVFTEEAEWAVRWRVLEDNARGLPPIELWVEAVQPTPVVSLTVTPENYRPGEWSNVAPTFELSGVEAGSTDYVYGVFICNERLIILSRDTTAYVPDMEGEDIRLRFAILDMMGDVVAFSDEYAMMLDMTPPDGPYAWPYNDANTIAQVYASDSLSGLEAISLDGGRTWLSAELSDDHFRCEGERGESIPSERLRARDFAGNVSVCYEEYTFGPERSSGGGTGTGKKPIRHVAQSLDYSHANYNALELAFSDEPQTQLIAGEETLNLNLSVNGAAGSFLAEMGVYPTEEGVTPPTFNMLTLTAQTTDGAVCAWRFTGDVCRLLYNSCIDYLVLRAGDYITVLPTAGFTAGTEYVRLKAGGVSTRRFAYTVTQDEALLETMVMVSVEDGTYELSEEHSNPMYRTGVLIGPVELLERPYGSYLTQEE